ncbi:DUF3368 domain-containing protein [Tundrisphaera sp. TA3]|uniref:DUF3368 domain-containing protein n=1 Tax=Tundrisphaera sp. TA3 TaxID=3435775 RepID=UPI003EB99D37
MEAELSSRRRSPEVRSFIATRPAWLVVRDAATVEVIEGLHPGETGAIALAREIGADRIILDERRARNAASDPKRGLNVIGTIGVLEAAAERGLLDLGEAFEAVKRTDFWVSHDWLDGRLSRFLARQ